MVVADVQTSNGAMHIVDKVILPLDILGNASANENFSFLINTFADTPCDLVALL